MRSLTRFREHSAPWAASSLWRRPVKRAIIENGKAVGVMLQDGREIGAARCRERFEHYLRPCFSSLERSMFRSKIAHRAKKHPFEQGAAFLGKFCSTRAS